MTASPQTSPQVGKTPIDRLEVLALLVELRDLRAENRRLRRRNRWLELSKNEWKQRAKGERWRSLRWPRNISA